MAVIIPFADADAHGSICDTVSFRRSRGKVIFQKKPKPIQPNSPGQQDQKEWFKDTWKEWRGITAGQKSWLEYQASQEDTTPANLYFDFKKEYEIGTGTPLDFIKDITACTIDNPIGQEAEHLHWFLGGVGSPPLGLVYSSGEIWDNTNTWIHWAELDPYTVFMFWVINNPLDKPITIPDGYSFTFTYKKFNDDVETVTVKFPEIILPAGTRKDYYADTVWALYPTWPLDTPDKVNPDAWPPAT